VAGSKRPIANPTNPTKAELQRWQAGYRRSAERQRELTATEGFDRRHAVKLAVDLLDAGSSATGRRLRTDITRRREVDAVRAIWRRLRAPHVATS
jgi:hypothetical protein